MWHLFLFFFTVNFQNILAFVHEWPFIRSTCDQLVSHQTEVGLVGFTSSGHLLLLDHYHWNGYYLPNARFTALQPPYKWTLEYDFSIDAEKLFPALHWTGFAGPRGCRHVRNSFLMCTSTQGHMALVVQKTTGDSLALAMQFITVHEDQVKPIALNDIPTDMVLLSSVGDALNAKAVKMQNGTTACLADIVFVNDFDNSTNNNIKGYRFERSSITSACMSISSSIDRGLFHDERIILFHSDGIVSIASYNVEVGELNIVQRKPIHEFLVCNRCKLGYIVSLLLTAAITASVLAFISLCCYGFWHIYCCRCVSTPTDQLKMSKTKKSCNSSKSLSKSRKRRSRRQSKSKRSKNNTGSQEKEQEQISDTSSTVDN